MSARRKATFYMDGGIHKALRMKAAEADISPSELLDAILAERLSDYIDDLEDVADVKARAKESGRGLTISDVKKKYKLNDK